MLFLSFVCLAVRSGAFTDIVQGGGYIPLDTKTFTDTGGGWGSELEKPPEYAPGCYGKLGIEIKQFFCVVKLYNNTLYLQCGPKMIKVEKRPI